MIVLLYEYAAKGKSYHYHISDIYISKYLAFKMMMMVVVMRRRRRRLYDDDDIDDYYYFITYYD